MRHAIRPEDLEIQYSIACPMNSADYKLVSKTACHATIITPDPHAAAIRKRSWEKQMQEWRKELRRIADYFRAALR